MPGVLLALQSMYVCSVWVAAISHLWRQGVGIYGNPSLLGMPIMGTLLLTQISRVSVYPSTTALPYGHRALAL
jgi:hypothetical protein